MRLEKTRYYLEGTLKEAGNSKVFSERNGIIYREQNSWDWKKQGTI